MKCHQGPTSFRGQSGLTLLELMITVAVIAILVSVAVPSYQDISRSLTVRGAAFQLFETVHLGRSEALKRNSEDVALKFLTPGTGDWCIRLTDAPDSCSSCAYEGQANKCDIDGEGIVRGVDGAHFPNVSLSSTYTTLNLSQRRNTLASGNVRFELGTKTACLVTSSLGRARLCTPSGSDAIWGMEQCEVNVCSSAE
ncbi:prepilin-type N-terminal cleavage/methylation domain-containing protein [Marinobacter hydrocarbonoclasticus]|nr:prepilin-type N-terminal cleavage/methylation domain-containing protein [Marinobacter nauticus]